jgi:catechol 2,3-dioxygenase-like lactoylglutathione lyase family enzyme
MKLARAAALAFALALAAPAHAQLGERNQLGVRMGHVHVLARDVETQKRFWTEMIGGTLVHNGALDMIEFPGVYVVLTAAQDPPAPAGAIVDHFGFMVKDFAAALARWKAAGIELEPLENPNEVYVRGPDGIRVEVYGEPALAGTISVTHVHLYPDDVPAIKAWYVKMFGANPSRRACIACISRPRMYETADIAAVNLTLTPSDQARAPTRGRTIDHIGFDVEDLDAFVRTLAAKGVSLEGPVQRIPGTSVKSAFLTDPWGTRIELTEGLAPR